MYSPEIGLQLFKIIKKTKYEHQLKIDAHVIVLYDLIVILFCKYISLGVK